MANKREELVGTYGYTRNRFPGGCVIGQLDNGVTVKGDVPEDSELCRGITYRFFGRWDDHPRWGRQFVFANFVTDSPSSKEGVIRYLTEYAAGVGQVKAARLFETFGHDAVDVLAENPERVVAAKILTAEDAEESSKTLRAKSAERKVTVELMGLFEGRGFPQKLVSQCIGKWGTAAAEKVRQDPFALIDAGLRGAGFLRTDRLYLDLKHDPADLRRQMHCVCHALKSSGEGHTWHPIAVAADALRKSVSGAKIRPTDAINLAVSEERLTAWKGEVKKGGHLALHTHAANEQVVAEEVNRLRAPTSLVWPDPSTLAVGPHQAATLARAFQNAVCALTGTPGVGKTFSAAAVARALCERLGTGAVAACAPTGKAAVRLTQKFIDHSVPIRATTIHKLLKVTPSTLGGGFDFGYNRMTPLPYRIVIVDECSMVDVDLFAHLLIALPKGCHLLLVGDPHQLMPVGHGAPLRDLLAAGIPVGELTEIRRNSGLIIHACRDIKDGKPYRTADSFRPHRGRNFLHHECPSPEAAVSKLRQVMDDIRTGQLKHPDRGPWDVFDDVQVVAPRNDKSAMSRKAVNDALQQLLNPDGLTAGKNPFRRGDKIVCLRNGLHIPLMSVAPDLDAKAADLPGAEILDRARGPLLEPQKHWFTDDRGVHWHDFANAPAVAFVANGEIGRVCAVEERITVARFPHPDRVIKIPMGPQRAKDDEDEEDAGRGCQFDLGYCVTGHKAQGSEWPVVVLLADKHAGWVCSRNWWYTSIGRAADLLVTVGEQATIDRHCRRIATWERKTFLVDLLKG